MEGEGYGLGVEMYIDAEMYQLQMSQKVLESPGLGQRGSPNLWDLLRLRTRARGDRPARAPANA